MLTRLRRPLALAFTLAAFATTPVVASYAPASAYDRGFCARHPRDRACAPPPRRYKVCPRHFHLDRFGHCVR